MECVRRGRWQDYVCLNSVEGVVAVFLGVGMEHMISKYSKLSEARQ